MENKLQVQQRDILSLEDNPKLLDIALVVFHVNQLMPYPLTDPQVADWAKSIDQLMPDLDVNELRRVINDMKMDKIEWDNKKGIQNLFRALLPAKITGYSPDNDNTN